MASHNRQNVKIFTVCAVVDIAAEHHNRTFGWFPTFKEAEKRVLKSDEHDIHECYYDYVVIEEFASGILVIGKNPHWYKWNRKQKKYLPIKQPKEVANVINWGMC